MFDRGPDVVNVSTMTFSFQHKEAGSSEGFRRTTQTDTFMAGYLTDLIRFVGDVGRRRLRQGSGISPVIGWTSTGGSLGLAGVKRYPKVDI